MQIYMIHGEINGGFETVGLTKGSRCVGKPFGQFLT